MRRVAGLMRRAVARGVFPGGSLRVAVDGDEVFACTCGSADAAGDRPVHPATLFDLASLTKPLATTLGVVTLVQDGRLDLDQSLGELLADVTHRRKGRISVRQLLAHNGGLPAYRAYFRQLTALPPHERRSGLDRLLTREPLIADPGSVTVYSDLGFMLLRRVVETVSGERLDRFVARGVFRPLGLADLLYIDLNGPRPAREFVVTESCPWRGATLEGCVHDENAYAVGGIDGHAGLFGTAAAVGALLDELLAAYRGLGASGRFDRRVLREFLRPQTPGGRALGFDTPSPQGSSSGRWFSARSVGHLGFTGTSFWVDLVRGVSVVLLTNRVHPTRDNPGIKTFRPLLHDAVMEALGFGA